MKNTLMQYISNNPWVITENGFDSETLQKVEAVFCLGNGYMGVRSSTEETYVKEKRGVFVAGTFNKFFDEVTELPVAPDTIAMEFIINDTRLTLDRGKFYNHKRELNLRTGELRREFQWCYKDINLHFSSRRFVSFKRKNVFSSEVVLSNLGDAPLQIELISGINGQISNSGAAHFLEGEMRLIDDKFLYMHPTTTQSNIGFNIAVTHHIKAKKERVSIKRRTIEMHYLFDLEPNNNTTIRKDSAITTSIDKQIFNVVDVLKEVVKCSFDELLTESANEWQNKVWNIHPITIDSTDFKDQLAINFAKYHLHVMTPIDERMNVAAKGLSGEGYKGHTFWDTEIFILPYFIFTHPDIAKSLVSYRYLGLEGAYKKAASNGYKGSQFPWEAAWPPDGETTPVWGAANIVTGEQTKILSGFIEDHIIGDVAYGVKQFLDVTGDNSFEQKAIIIILETAKFWISRLAFNEARQTYEIHNVIGPDEYKEHVNNNAYTNYIAYWNIDLALKLCKDAPVEWREILNKIYLPKPDDNLIIPQDDTYLSKQFLDLTPYKTSSDVGRLFHDYSLEQVNAMQITKQADVLLLLFLFEHLFTQETKKANFEYYEPRTTHDSSLSLSTHAILAADLKEIASAYGFFKRAINIDMGEYMYSSNEGVHAASLGGIWQMVVFGFGGVRVLDGVLRIEPSLPEAWNKLDFGITFQGQKLKITINKDNSFKVEKTGNKPLTYIYKGQEITI